MTKQVSIKILTSTITLVGFLLISTSSLALTSFHCSNLKGCEKKFCEIEKQLNIAQEKNNDRKADGLKKALSEAKDHCTDKGLKEDIVGEIKEIKEEIAEYESDLKEAKKYGKTDKVRKYQEKVEEEKVKVKRLEDELSNLN